MEFYGEAVSSDQGPEEVIQASSSRALYILRVGIENAGKVLSLPTINKFMFLRLGAFMCII